MKQNSTQKFYDQLSDDYHLIFADWENAIQRQAKNIKNLFDTHGILTGTSILDCSCGIGTQALGLAQKGYKMTASDLSPIEIGRAKQEAEKRSLDIDFFVSDFRELEKNIAGVFDVVISFDNSLPHLIAEDDMMLAIKNIFSKTKKGGYFIGSIRDYDEILKTKPISTPANVKQNQDGKTISFQVWDWEENIYEVEHITLEKKEDYITRVRKVLYRAWKRQELSDIYLKNGFTDVQWYMSEDTNYYQPIFIAKK